MKQLSIIVPVYQVERFIRPCIESIYQQELEEKDFELILVNDGTHDRSFEVIADLIAAHTNIIEVKQVNQGLSAARNAGLAKAEGEYVLFLDSDDMLFNQTLRPLLSDAISQQPDLLIAGFSKMTNEEMARLQPLQQNYHSEVMSGEQAFVQHLNPQQCYVWRTLYRKAFLTDNNICFMPGIYFEDVPFTTECYLKAKRCVVTDYTFYVYRQRPGSIVSAINKKKVMDFHHVLERLWTMYRQMPLTADQRGKLMDTIFTTFSIELWYITHNKMLLAERGEIMQDLKQRVPELHFTGGSKQRFVSFCYRYLPQLYIRLRAL